MDSKEDSVKQLMRLIKVVIVDDRHMMRKVVRTLLMSIGVERIFEAGDGVSGLETICSVAPHLVLLDWDMPTMGGAEFVRKVRLPGVFPQPDVPIVVLSGHRDEEYVAEALRLGVNDYLVKPVLGRPLLDCILSVITKPRPFVQLGDYYGPQPLGSSPPAA
jgi:two-component system, chemotaxis family, chemotaxis protein CheY